MGRPAGQFVPSRSRVGEFKKAERKKSKRELQRSRD